jgi:hypothetical protein
MAHTLSRAKDPNIQFKTSEDFKRDFTSDGKIKAAFAYYGAHLPAIPSSLIEG